MTEGNPGLWGGQARSTVLPTQATQYGIALLAVTLALGTTLLLGAYLEPTPTPLFFVAVMVSAWYGGLRPGIVATILSTLAINYFLLEPLYTLNIPNLGTVVRLGVFMMAALLINSLNEAQRTARRRAEANFQSLRESEARFGCLAESNIIGMLVAELDGTILEANHNFLQLVGYTQEELRAGRLHWRKMTAPESLEVSERAVQELLTTGACKPFEKEYIRKDGSCIPILHGAVMTGEHTVTGFVLDLRDRKQAEAALRQSEERLRVALKNSPITVFNQDQELRYTWIYNPAFGHRIPEVIGKQDRDLLPEEEAAILTRIKRHVLETGSGVREEVKLTMHNQAFYYDLAVEPLQTEAGDTIGITCASMDITGRKQMELALRQSETTLNALIASSPIGIAFFDRELRYVHVNEALAATNGVPLSEHFGRTFWDVLPQWAPAIAPILQQVMETQKPLLNQEVVGATHPSDVIRYGLINYFPVCLTDGEVLGVGVTSVDITDRKRVQQELQHTLQTLQTIVTASPLPIVVIEPDLTVKLWNLAAERLFGWSEAEVLGQLIPIVPAEKQDECRQVREAVVKGETFFGKETYRCKRDGSTVILNILAAPLYGDQGSVDTILLILQDITAQQQAAVNLRDSEERLRLALIAANQGLYDLNVQTGDAIVSPAYAQMLGYDPDEFQETNARWRDRLHPDDVDVVYQAYQNYISGILAIYRVEFRQRTKAGDWQWILSIGKIVSWDSEGRPLRMLGTHTDITERKQAETEREQLLVREKVAREQAETANRIKDEFLAVLSHELRSPLNPILGWSKLLQQGQLDAAQTRQALQAIERNAKLQAELIEDLLDVSRILQGKLNLNVSAINLAATIRAAMETVQLAAAAKAIKLAASFEPDPPFLQGDSTRLQQVIWNLLSNAVKFTPTGGQVNIRLERLDAWAQITISDTGQGIEPAFLPHVFDYFRQADAATTRKFGGLGLGLAIVRHLVELHGGTVAVASPGVGSGATFTVKLPLSPIQASARQPEQASAAASTLHGIRVLVVDDEPDSREFVAFVLEQAGAAVMTATTASEALGLLQRWQLDVLLSDIGMPAMDGYMLLQQVRALPAEQGGQVPAIALTAYAGDFNQQQARQAGFQQHVSKPVEPEQLIQVIASLIKA
jgi:PAS domain S-box-containing protein